MGQLKYWDGSNWVDASTGVVGPTGPTGPTGATGPVAGSANQVVYKDSSNNPAGSANLTFDGTTLTGVRAVISDNSTSDALRITQVGTGNALVVEDSTNPDSTPVVIDAEGRLIVGYTTSLGSRVQSIGTGQGAFLAAYFAANNSGSGFDAYKSRNTTIGSHTAVQANDSILRLAGWGSDGTNYQISGSVEVGADATPSAGIVPGFVSFKTASATGNLTERLKVDSAGLVTIASTVKVNGVEIDPANPTTGEVLQYNGTKFVAADIGLENHFLLMGA